MKSLTCTFTKESSGLKVQICFCTEIVLHSLALSGIVKELKTVLNEMACELLQRLFHAIDDIWLKDREDGIRICKPVDRSLKTIFGEVLFRYRQAKKDGKYYRPLLEALGIDKYQRISDDLIDLVRRSALYTSYRKALKIGSHICALSTLWSTVQKEGKAYCKKRDDTVYYCLEGESPHSISSSDFAIVMMDEIWLRKRKKKGEAQKKKIDSKKIDSKKKKREYIKVKVARCSVAHKVGDSYVWEPLRVMATARGTQDEFLKKAQKFFNATCGLGRIQKIMVLTDGCDMGKKFCALYPEGQAVWQLDWWHLFDHVRKGCKFEKNLEKEVCGFISVEKVGEALALLHAYRLAMTCMEKKLEDTLLDVHKEFPSLVKPKVFWSTRQRENLEHCITYLENNREGIYGVKAFEKDIPAEFLAFGTGPLERLQAVMIAYRMKKQGKHWSVPGADNLIQLLSREWNGEALEHIIEEGLEGLSAWEASCIPQEEGDSGFTHHLQSQKKSSRMDFSPLPQWCIPILQRGKTDSFFTPLKRIGELKLIPRIVEFRKEGCHSL